jgi:ABC-2 type transport system ATP-binding protein
MTTDASPEYTRMTNYLTAQHVYKKYGDRYAVKNASLEMRQGEILALLGPNGAGKTTFIKILATLLMKDEGQVTVLGYDLDRNPEQIRHLFGYVGQDTERSAYARLSVLENLRYFGMLRGQINQQIEKLAAAFDFRENLDKLFVTLSGGQKQTVVIMRAFLHDPPLVYLDEPTKGLDPIIARKIRKFLKDFVYQENKSLLLTSHVLSEVDEMANRVALIHHGAIPIVGTSDSLKAAIGASEFVEIEDCLPASTLDRINHLDPVLFSMQRDPGWISFGVKDAMAGAEAIIRTLREDQVQAKFRHHSVTLEDAFLHHVGDLAEKFDQ